MNSKIKQQNKKAIAEAKEKFLKNTRLKDIHFADTSFFQDVILWGVRPIRLFVDAVSNLLVDEEDTEMALLLLAEVQEKLDDLIEHMERWEQEEMAANKKQKAA